MTVKQVRLHRGRVGYPGSPKGANMAVRLRQHHYSADAGQHIQDLVLERPDLSVFLAELASHWAQRADRGAGELSCAVTVLRRSAPVIAGSSPAARKLEELQNTCGEGPGLTAAQDMTTVLVTDLRTEERWPAFIREARDEKVLSIAALPIELQSETKAAVSFYSRRPHGFAIAPLEALVQAASPGLRLMLRITELEENELNLKAAMKARTPIELATGIIMGRERCTPDAAYLKLFETSRSRNLNVRDLADEIITSVAGNSTVNTHFDA